MKKIYLLIILILISVINCKDNKEENKINHANQINKNIEKKSDINQENNNLSILIKEIDKDNKNISSSQINMIKEDDILVGNKDSDIIIIEYFSPNCSHCNYYHKHVFPKIKETYIDTNKVTYIMREFISNKQDLDASILARCSFNRDKFLSFIDILLQQQEGWILKKNYKEILTNIGVVGGISPEKYANCSNSMPPPTPTYNIFGLLVKSLACTVEPQP